MLSAAASLRARAPSQRELRNIAPAVAAAVAELGDPKSKTFIPS